MNSAASRIALWQLISPALPIGAFAWSDGLEAAVDCGWVDDEDSAGLWIADILRDGVGRLDAPVLLRLHAAFARMDYRDVAVWNAFLAASRETMELGESDHHLGRALWMLLPQLGVARPEFDRDPPPSYACAFALAAQGLGIEPEDMAHGFLWSWCENQVAAAVKLVPLGQSAGQRLLRRLAADLPGVAAHAATLDDEHIGAVLPGLAIASARHEAQYSRLFRS